MKLIIIIQSISFRLTGALIIRTAYIKRIHASVIIASPLNDNQLPADLFDKSRKQWKSDKILRWLLDKSKPGKDNKILEICDFDAYSSGLNLCLDRPKLMVEYPLSICQG